MSLIIGNTPEQLQQGLLIDGDLWTASRIAALQAQVNALRDGVRHFNRSGGDMNPLLKAYINTPAQCLADTQAQAGRAGFVEGFNIGYLHSSLDEGFNPEWFADEYASRIREGK